MYVYIFINVVKMIKMFMFHVYHFNIGLPSLVNFMTEYMTKNVRRNSKQQLVFNCTGHQSVMIMQSMPYCLKQAAIDVEQYEINQVIKYIEANLCDDDEYVTDVEVDIHWADDVSVCNDVLSSDDNVNNDVNVNIGAPAKIDSSSGDDNLNIDNNNNDNVNHEDVNVNTGEQLHSENSSVDLPLNLSMMVDSDININSNSEKNYDVDVNVMVNNNASTDSSVTQHESDWLDSDILKDSVSERLTNSDSEFDQKQEMLPGVDDVINQQNNNVNVNINDNVDIANKANFKQYCSNVKPLQYKDINFHYRYTVSGCDKVFLLDNNDNKCNIKYSRTFQLGAMFDYCSLLRKVFCVFATLKWSKKLHKTTPNDIKMAQLWGRTAIYKATLISRWLLHDYAMLAGGVGGYMLEAFWHYNPEGYGFYFLNQQMVEHWGHWMKKNRIAVGDGEGDAYLYEIADNYDINVLGRVLADAVDFSDVVNKEKLRSVDIFDLEQNDEVEKNALSEGPIFWQMVCNSLSKINVNDKLHEYIYKLGEEDDDKYAKLADGLKESVRLSRENQKNFEQSYNDEQEQKKQQQQWQSNLQNVSEIREKAKNQHKPHSRKDQILAKKQKKSKKRGKK